jgi:hypothetical protein
MLIIYLYKASLSVHPVKELTEGQFQMLQRHAQRVDVEFQVVPGIDVNADRTEVSRFVLRLLT